jgi:hypothetical protein
MNKTFFPRTALRELLVRHGHVLGGDGEGSTDVSPAPEAIVTVAMDLDPTLDPAYRERYFATLLDRDDCKPLLRDHPDFALPEPFVAAVAKEPIGGRHMRGNFLLGPFRWLIRRLVRFPRLLLWPEHQIRASDGLMRVRWVLDEMPEFKGWLEGAGPVPSDAGAIELDLSDIADCRVLWEVAEQVEASFYNYFVGDPEATEVYELHHHSRVVVSIPEPSERQRLLNDLSRYHEVIEDCSGSILNWGEDEDDEVEEAEGTSD